MYLAIRNLTFFLVFMFLFSQVGAKDKAYVFTLEEIKKTGVLEKCNEVAQLRKENLNAKADRIWEEFQKKYPKLFTKSGINGDLFGFALSGKWVPVARKPDEVLGLDVLCQESDTECRKGRHDSYSEYGDMKYHVHVSFSESRKSQEVFEQAAHDQKFIELAILFSMHNGLVPEMLDKISSDHGAFTNEWQCSFMKEGRISMEAIIREMSKESFKPLEKEAKE